MLDQPLQLFCSFASEIADVARQIVRTAAAGPRRPVAKSDSSPVTETDRAVEQSLRDASQTASLAMGCSGRSLAPGVWGRGSSGSSIILTALRLWSADSLSMAH